MTTFIRGGTVVNHDDHTRRPTFPAVHVANATWKELMITCLIKLDKF